MFGDPGLGDDDAGDDDAGDDDAGDDDDDDGDDDDDAIGDDDDATSPPGDDDDDDDAVGDDDDATSSSGTLSFDPSSVTAGWVGWVDLQLQNFSIGADTQVCCADETEVALFDFDGDSAVPRGWFFFSVLAPSSVSWGMEDLGVQVQDSFQVTPLPSIPTVAAGMAVESGVIGSPEGYEVYAVDVPAADTVLSVAATSTGSTSFEPWIWILGSNGMDLLAINPIDGEVSSPYFANALIEDPGLYYIRVMDRQQLGGSDYSYDLDVALDVVGGQTSVDVPEVESNDAAPDWQSLGTLGAGDLLNLSGTSSTAGNNPTTYDWTGDLDVFTFDLEASSTVTMELSWPDELNNDFDAMLYDPSSGTPDVGAIESTYSVDLGMASLDYPETSTIQLLGDKEYVLMVANWDGQAGASWDLELRVLGAAPSP